MWFKNALLFNYRIDQSIDLNHVLQQEIMRACPPHARFTYGWAPAFSDELVQEIAGCALICLGKEERVLPRGVIKKLLDERIQAMQTQQGRTIKRTEKSQLAENLEFELLPKSFCLQKRLFALLDTTNQRLIIDSASANQATQLMALLRKSIPGIHIEPLPYQENLALQFTEWINNPALLSPAFQLASDCHLFSLTDEKKRFTCKGYELPATEVVTLLSQGLAAAEISLIWKERIQFTLTDSFILKRITCLDYLADEFSETRQLEEDYLQQDAALTLLAGELRMLIDDLLAETNSPRTL